MDEIFKRQSVRKFRDRPVEEEKITEMIKAGMRAPSNGNQQPWEFFVLKDKDNIKKLKEASPYSLALDSAPVAIVLAMRKDGLFPETREIDMAMATENMLLEAVSQELGGVLLAIAPYEDRMNKAKEILDIPEDLDVFGILATGYRYNRTPMEERFEEDRIHYLD